MWARINAGLTQKELARELQVQQNSVSSWERGVTDPHCSTLRDLCCKLSVSADYLLGLSKQ